VDDFVYRTASDFALHARHFRRIGTVDTMDADAAAICSGIAADEITRRVRAESGPVITDKDLERGLARTDLVRVKLGREPSVFDVLREFGDESTEAGLLLGGASG
jgi:hypothetical protein